VHHEASSGTTKRRDTMLNGTPQERWLLLFSNQREEPKSKHKKKK
jgi:hypothetical protein